MMYLAIPADRKNHPRLFRLETDAFGWLTSNREFGGGDVFELERIEISPEFQVIHQYTNSFGGPEFLR